MKIGQFEIGKHGIYTIAEIGKNHQGDVDIAKRLIDAAQAAGCHAVKFQAYHTEHLLHTYSKSGAEPDLEWLRKCELQPIELIDLKNFCDMIGITFLCTPESEQWVDVLAHSVHVPAFKVSSLNINNYKLLDKIAKKALPVILSTGMSTMDEVAVAIGDLTYLARNIALLHCVSQYPAKINSLNLRAMSSMREYFGVPVGFSDHTMKGVGAKLAACAGAELLEFHITLDNDMEGPDHKFSLNPEQLKCMTTSLWEIQTALGSGTKQPHASEGDYVWQKRRCCVARRDIQRYEIITEDHIICLCPGHEDYISAGEFYHLTSGYYEATRFIKKGTPIFNSSVKVI